MFGSGLEDLDRLIYELYIVCHFSMVLHTVSRIGQHTTEVESLRRPHVTAMQSPGRTAQIHLLRPPLVQIPSNNSKQQQPLHLQPPLTSHSEIDLAFLLTSELGKHASELGRSSALHLLLTSVLQSSCLRFDVTQISKHSPCRPACRP